MNSHIAQDGTTKNNIHAANGYSFMSSMWLKRAYINLISDASDISKVMKHQGFGSKSTFHQ
jgi:hypothetical protein